MLLCSPNKYTGKQTYLSIHDAHNDNKYNKYTAMAVTTTKIHTTDSKLDFILSVCCEFGCFLVTNFTKPIELISSSVQFSKAQSYCNDEKHADVHIVLCVVVYTSAM